jgi:uncharacterized membrane protein YraQ (UPF0718 family)
MIFTGFVLGWQWVGLRLLVGLFLVFGIAYVVGAFLKTATSCPEDQAVECPIVKPELLEDNVWLSWLRSLWHLSKGVIPEFVVLLFLLGAARAWLFPAFPSNTNGIFWIIGLAIAGTLFVVPTAGEIPIVQTLMANGLGVGPAAALLITLPAVSLPSLVMLSKSIPLKALVFLSFAVMVLGVVSGVTAVMLGF